MPQSTINSLDLEFMPASLVGREKQLDELYQLVVNTEYSNENVWIEGGPGLGKTTTVKFFVQKVNYENLGKAFYIGCERSMRNAIDRVRLQYRLPLSKRDISSAGFATAVMKAFPNTKYFFVIDEPDKVYAKRDIANFIHCLWNYLSEGSAKYSFIFVSKYSLTDMMSKVFPPEANDTFSRLQPKSIVFPVYDVPEIVAILKQRLDIQNARYDLAALTLIGIHIRRIGGDMRQALELTREALRITSRDGSGAIDPSVAEQAIEWGKNTWWERRLKSIPPHWAFITYVAANYCYQKGHINVELPVVKLLYLATLKQLNKHILAMELGREPTDEEFAALLALPQKQAPKRIDPVGDSTVYWMIKQCSGSNTNVAPLFEQRLAKYGLQADIVFGESDRDRIAKVGMKMNWAEYLTMTLPHGTTGGC